MFLQLERGKWIKGKRKWEKGDRRFEMRKRRREKAVYWSHKALLSADEEQWASRETTVNSTAESKLTASTLNLCTIITPQLQQILNSPIVLWNWPTTWPTSDYVWFSRKLKKSLFFKALCDIFWLHTQKKKCETLTKSDFLMIWYFIIVIL